MMSYVQEGGRMVTSLAEPKKNPKDFLLSIHGLSNSIKKKTAPQTSRNPRIVVFLLAEREHQTSIVVLISQGWNTKWWVPAHDPFCTVLSSLGTGSKASQYSALQQEI